MRLELKHLTPYLTYNTKIQANQRIYVLTSDIIARREKNRTLEKVKLILHPLSNLTKEIEVNGEKFVPIEKLKELVPYNLTYEEADIFTGFKLDNGTHIVISCLGNISDNCEYWIVQKLLEWHFDLYNLIENGLAIDINTLNK